MVQELPDPIALAQSLAKICSTEEEIYRPINRLLTDQPYLDRDAILNGVRTFYAEQMAKVPSSATYPEAAPWVDLIKTRDRELQRITGMSDTELALNRSLKDFCSYRWKAAVSVPGGEKCRVAFVPDTERGPVHIKNVDDPITHWTPRPAPDIRTPGGKPAELPPIFIDGVGSGLLIDDEPEELFPLNAREMVSYYADDTPGAVEFLTRYTPFWHSCNIVVRDRQHRSVAIEKCSPHYIDVFEPGPDGRSHISGMVCRDPESDLGKHQAAKRNEALDVFDRPKDGSDQTFWNKCDEAEAKLAEFLAQPGPLKFEDIWAKFATPWPDGLSKEGAKFHPDQQVAEYTLVTHALLLDEMRGFRIQRDPQTTKMQAERETWLA